MAEYSNERLKEFGYTHIATRKTEPNKGERMPVTYNPENGDYENGMCALLDPEIHFDLEIL